MEQTKKCRGKCGLELPLSSFPASKNGGKFGVEAKCYECKRIHRKEYDDAHREQRRKQKLDYYYRHWDEERGRNKKYCEEHKDEISAKAKVRHETNRETDNAKQRERAKADQVNRAAYTRAYRKAHPEETREYVRNYWNENKESIKAQRRERAKKNPSVRIASNLRRRLLEHIKGKRKVGSAVRDLGCTIEELKARFVSMFYTHPTTDLAMTWDNYGQLWHIDHIIPLSHFDLTDYEQVQIACHYLNLQPLWAEENKSKCDALPGNLDELKAIIKQAIEKGGKAKQKLISETKGV
jgi:hypothetical protein